MYVGRVMIWHRNGRGAALVRAGSALLGVILVAGLVVAGPKPASAHGDGKEHHAPVPFNGTAQMKAAEADRAALAESPSIIASPVPCVSGQAAGYPCNNVDLEAFVALVDMGAANNERANDVWGWADSGSGREFALLGTTFGTSFVEVTDPQNPVYIGDLHTHGDFGSSWRDIKVYANHAYIVSEATAHGLQVFDLTQLLNVANPPVVFDETAHYGDFGTAHNVVINEESGYAYVVGASGAGSCNGGLHMVDINQPSSPQNAGCYSDDGYTHDAHCVIYDGPDTAHVGQEICFNSNEDTLTIVDVTDKANPVMLSRTTYANYGYVHQGWLTEDHTHFLLDDELDEYFDSGVTQTRIFTVADLDAPSMTGTHNSANTAIDHNQYVVGDYAYQANYRAGLRILDITDIAAGSLEEVASFDVFPADDATNFNGAWSVYPFLPSGNLLVSSIEGGLFVLRANLGGPVVDSPPIASVDEALDGAFVGGDIDLIAGAGDDFGIDRVEFAIDGVQVGVDQVGTNGWTFGFDTATVEPGSRTLTVTAVDGSGQMTSDSRPLTVIGIGDVNCSGDLEINDALLIAQFEVGNRTDAGCPLANPGTEIFGATGDVNDDNNTNIVDALLIAQCSVGIEAAPCQNPA